MKIIQTAFETGNYWNTGVITNAYSVMDLSDREIDVLIETVDGTYFSKKNFTLNNRVVTMSSSSFDHMLNRYRGEKNLFVHSLKFEI